MEITIPSIISLMTFIIGYLVKTFNLLDSKYIPLQNIIIGIISGIIAFLIGLDNNILNAIVICLISALSAGGLYDVIKKEDTYEDEL